MNQISVRLLPHLLTTTAVAALLCCAPSLARGQGAQGGSVAAGNARIEQQGTNTTIRQGSDRAILDWRQFSIGSGEVVRFDQPGRSSVTLNRVTGSQGTRIDGSLSANGQVWIANPNGVLVGPSGSVNAAGLLATTGRVDADQFLRNGRAVIDQVPSGARVANHGVIDLGRDGYAALAAASVSNAGTIRAGTVALGAGKGFAVDLAGDRLIGFQVQAPLTEAPGDGATPIDQTGTIIGRDVLMSARAAKGVVDRVVNLAGHVVGTSITVIGGTVMVGDGGRVVASGTIDASAQSGVGGAVTLTSPTVAIEGAARIDASGPAGGGLVRIGGGWQGKDADIPNAEATQVAPGAEIVASARILGPGGTVVVWADDATYFGGRINASGGPQGGDGGRVETSGKRRLDIGADGSVVTAAPAGRAGDWLLDPADITIDGAGAGILTSGTFAPTGATGAINASTIVAALNLGSNVTITTQSGTGGTGNITVTAPIAKTAGAAATLSLLADASIQISANITSTSNALNVVLNSGAQAANQAAVVGAIKVDAGVIINSLGGNISLVGGLGGAFNAVGDGVISASGIQIAGTLNAGVGAITLRGNGQTNPGSGNVAGVKVETGASVQTTSGAITIVGNGPASMGFDFGAGIVVQGATIASNTGNLSITGTGSAGAGAATTSHYGVAVEAAALIQKTGAGTMVVTGTGGSSTTGGRHVGVSVHGGAIVRGNGAAAVTVSGTGGSGVGEQSGVQLGRAGEPTGTIAHLGTGSLTIVGVRGSGTAASTNIAVNAAGAVISVASGTLSLDASASTGGGAVIGNYGIDVTGGGVVSSSGGNISMTGTAAAAGTGTDYGIFVSAGTITAGGAGAITMTATGPGGGVSRAGFVIDTGGIVATAGGSIAITGQSAPGFDGIRLLGGTIASGTTGATTLTTDHQISFLGSPTISTTGTVTFAPVTAATSIGVNGGGGTLQVSAGLIGLTAATATVQVGHAAGTGLVTLAAAPLTRALRLRAPGTGTAGVTVAGAINGGFALALDAGAGTASFASGSVGAATPLASLDVTAATIPFATSPNVTTVGTQSYSGRIILPAGTANFYSTDAPITFAGGMDGAGSPFINAGVATVGLAGGIGGTTPLADITVAGNSTAAISGAINTTGTQHYNHSMIVLAGGATLSTTNNNILVAEVVNGPGALSVDTGTASLNLSTNAGSVTGLASLQVTAGTVNAKGAITTSGQISFSNVLAFNGAGLTLSTINSPVSVGGTVNGAFGLTIASGTGAVAVGGAIGGVTALTSFSSTGSGTVALGGDVTTTNAQNYGGALNLSANRTLTSTGGGTIALGGAQGTFDLTAATTGAVSLAGNFGTTMALASLDLGASAVRVTANTTIRTSGAGLASTGAIDSVGGANNLTIDVPGTARTIGANGVGATTAMGSFSLTAAQITLASTTVRTTGAQTYTGPTVVTGASTVSSTGGNVTFASAVNGPGQLFTQLATANTAAFQGGIGGTTALASFQANSGTVALGGNATTGGSGFGVFGGLRLLANSTVTTTGGMSLLGGIEGGFALTIDNPGTLSIAGGVGQSQALMSLTRLNGMDTRLSSTVATVGTQSYQSAVVLVGAATLSTQGGNILFNQSVDGGFNLNLQTGAGTTSFGGNVGTGTALASLTAAGTVAAPSIVRTAGTQSYSGALILGANTTLSTTSAAIAATGGVQGGFSLTANSGVATTTLSGGVGTTTALASLSVTGPTRIAGAVQTSGNQNFSAATTLAGDSSFTSTGGSVQFVGAMDASTPGGGGLTVNAAGGATFGGAIGGGTALSTVSVGAATSVSLAASVRTTGTQSFAGAVTLTGNAGFSTTNANITLGSTLNGAFTGSFAAGTGTVTLAGGVGGTTRLTSFTSSGGGAVALAGSIQTTGAQTITGPLQLLANVLLATLGAPITLLGPVNGGFGLTLDTGAASVTMANGVGTTTALTSLTRTGTGPTQVNGSFVTTGSQSFGGGLVLAGATSFTTTNAPLTVNGAIDGATSLSINTGSGAPTIQGPIGGTTALTTVTLSSTSGVNLPALSATGAVTINVDALTLLGLFSGAGGVTLNARNSLTLGTGGGIAAGAGWVTIVTDSFAPGAANTLSGGSLMLRPTSTSGSIGLGAATGNLSLAQAVLDRLANFATVQLGAPGGGTAFSIGGDAALRSATIFNGPMTLAAGSVLRTDGGSPITVQGPITLTGDATILGAANVMLGGTVNGPFTLTVAGLPAANLTALGAIGQINALAALNVIGFGSASFAESVTAGAVTIPSSTTLFQGPVNLGSFTGPNGSRLVAFDGGGQITAPVVFDTSGIVRLANLILAGGFTHTLGLTQVLGAIASTGGAITLGATQLLGDATLASGGGRVTLASLDGGASFRLDTGSGTGSIGLIGASQPLTAFNSAGTGALSLGGNVVTSGDQFYAGALDLAAAVILRALGGGVSTNDVITNGFSFSFDTPAGRVVQRGFLTLQGRVDLTQTTVYESNLRLGGDLTFVTGGRALTFRGRVDGAGRTLTIDAGTGAVTFNDAVGGASARLAQVTIVRAGNVTLANGARIFTQGFTQAAGSGTTDFGTTLLASGPVSVTTDLVRGAIQAEGARVAITARRAEGTVTAASLILTVASGTLIGTLNGSATATFVSLTNQSQLLSGALTWNGIDLGQVTPQATVATPPPPTISTSLRDTLLQVLAVSTSISTRDLASGIDPLGVAAGNALGTSSGGRIAEPVSTGGGSGSSVRDVILATGGSVAASTRILIPSLLTETPPRPPVDDRAGGNIQFPFAGAGNDELWR